MDSAAGKESKIPGSLYLATKKGVHIAQRNNEDWTAVGSALSEVR